MTGDKTYADGLRYALSVTEPLNPCHDRVRDRVAYELYAAWRDVDPAVRRAWVGGYPAWLGLTYDEYVEWATFRRWPRRLLMAEPRDTPLRGGEAVAPSSEVSRLEAELARVIQERNSWKNAAERWQDTAEGWERQARDLKSGGHINRAGTDGTAPPRHRN